MFSHPLLFYVDWQRKHIRTRGVLP